MSDENAGVVQAMFEAYKSGDIAAAAAAFDADVEFDMTFRPDGRIVRGHAGLAEGMRTWTGAFEGWSFVIEDIVEIDDHVLVTTRESGRGKGSGVEIEQVGFHVSRLRNGKIVHHKLYLDRAAALKAAGLSE